MIKSITAEELLSSIWTPQKNNVLRSYTDLVRDVMTKCSMRGVISGGVLVSYQNRLDVNNLVANIRLINTRDPEDQLVKDCVAVINSNIGLLTVLGEYDN